MNELKGLVNGSSSSFQSDKENFFTDWNSIKSIIEPRNLMGVVVLPSNTKIR